MWSCDVSNCLVHRLHDLWWVLMRNFCYMSSALAAVSINIMSGNLPWLCSHGTTYMKNCTQLSLMPMLFGNCHYSDVKISTMAYQIASLKIVYSTVYPGADQRKHRRSASLAFVTGIHRWPVNSPHKGPVTRKMFPFDYVILVSSQHCKAAVSWPLPRRSHPGISSCDGATSSSELLSTVPPSVRARWSSHGHTFTNIG